MRTIYITLLNIILVLSSQNSFSQSDKLKIEGRVVDASNNKPVEFANLGVEGTFLGTASDIDGNFNLLLDREYAGNTVVISAVGYQSKKMKASQLAAGNVVVKMTPAVYDLSEVDIKARSRILYGIVRSAGNLIPHNYVTGPLSYKTFYVREQDGNEKTEAVVSLIDNKGYGDRSYTDAFVNRSYKVDEIRRNFDYKPVRNGSSDLDGLLIFDIVRVRGNILDSAGLYDFKLKLEDISTYAGDSVWVISYTNDKPSFATTGNKSVISYSGVLYISKTTSAVLRNELMIETKGYFPYGYTFFYDEEIAAKDISGAKYKVITSYRKNDEDKYFLSSISVDKTLLSSNGNAALVNEGIKVIRADIANDEQTEGRDYYSLKTEDKEFWKRFTIPE
jgi:hypothetical protein